MDSYGHLGLGGAAAANRCLSMTYTYAGDNTYTAYNIYSSFTLNPSAAYTRQTCGFYLGATYTSSYNSNYFIDHYVLSSHSGTGTISSAYVGYYRFLGYGAGDVTTLYGNRSNLSQNTDSTADSVWANVYGYSAEIGCAAGAGLITTAYGIAVSKITGGAGNITNMYGVYIDATWAGAATLNYAIYNASTSPIYSAGDILLASAKVLKVNNIQVIGAQGAAVADATDAASVILRLNDLLARCRAHGIIAT
jgi:hypothetical protein